MAIPSITCPTCRRSVRVTAPKCPACGFALLELRTVDNRRSWRWHARTTAFAILIAILLALLGVAAVILLVDSYEEERGIESSNAAGNQLSVRTAPPVLAG